MQFLKKIQHLAKATFNKAIEDDIMTQGAAIAFYTIFSVAPLFILTISVSGLFFSEELITEQLQLQLEILLGENITNNLNEFLAQRSQDQSGVLASVLATIIIIFGATTVINQLKLTLNKIWNIGKVKISSVWHFFLNRLLSFGMIVLFSFLLLISLITETVIGLISTMFIGIIPNFPIDFYQFLSQIATIGFAVIFFMLIFKILPDVRAPWRDVLIGAVVTTLLFLLGKYLIGLYLSASGIETAYRAAGSLVIFVIWVYYNVQTILLGAVFTQVYTNMFGGQILPYKYVEFKITESTKNRSE